MIESGWLAYFLNRPWSTMAMLAVIGAFAYWKPKDTVKLIAMFLVIGAIAYVISFVVELGSTGIEQQRQLTSSPKNGPE